MVLRYDCFCLVKSRKPPLDLKIFIPGDALHDPTFFDEQLKFAGLIGIFSVAIEAGGKMVAPRPDPASFFGTLQRSLFPTLPRFPILYVFQPVSHRSILSQLLHTSHTPQP